MGGEGVLDVDVDVACWCAEGPDLDVRGCLLVSRMLALIDMPYTCFGSFKLCYFFC